MSRHSGRHNNKHRNNDLPHISSESSDQTNNGRGSGRRPSYTFHTPITNPNHIPINTDAFKSHNKLAAKINLRPTYGRHRRIDRSHTTLPTPGLSSLTLGGHNILPLDKLSSNFTNGSGSNHNKNSEFSSSSHNRDGFITYENQHSKSQEPAVKIQPSASKQIMLSYLPISNPKSRSSSPMKKNNMPYHTQPVYNNRTPVAVRPVYDRNNHIQANPSTQSTNIDYQNFQFQEQIESQTLSNNEQDELLPNFNKIKQSSISVPDYRVANLQNEQRPSQYHYQYDSDTANSKPSDHNDNFSTTVDNYSTQKYNDYYTSFENKPGTQNPSSSIYNQAILQPTNHNRLSINSIIQKSTTGSSEVDSRSQPAPKYIDHMASPNNFSILETNSIVNLHLQSPISKKDSPVSVVLDYEEGNKTIEIESNPPQETDIKGKKKKKTASPKQKHEDSNHKSSPTADVNSQSRTPSPFMPDAYVHTSQKNLQKNAWSEESNQITQGSLQEKSYNHGPVSTFASSHKGTPMLADNSEEKGVSENSQLYKYKDSSDVYVFLRGYESLKPHISNPQVNTVSFQNSQLDNVEIEVPVSPITKSDDSSAEKKKCEAPKKESQIKDSHENFAGKTKEDREGFNNGTHEDDDPVGASFDLENEDLLEFANLEKPFKSDGGDQNEDSATLQVSLDENLGSDEDEEDYNYAPSITFPQHQINYLSISSIDIAPRTIQIFQNDEEEEIYNSNSDSESPESSGSIGSETVDELENCQLQDESKDGISDLSEASGSSTHLKHDTKDLGNNAIREKTNSEYEYTMDSTILGEENKENGKDATSFTFDKANDITPQPLKKSIPSGSNISNKQEGFNNIEKDNEKQSSKKPESTLSPQSSKNLKANSSNNSSPETLEKTKNDIWHEQGEDKSQVEGNFEEEYYYNNETEHGISASHEPEKLIIREEIPLSEVYPDLDINEDLATFITPPKLGDDLDSSQDSITPSSFIQESLIYNNRNGIRLVGKPLHRSMASRYKPCISKFDKSNDSTNETPKEARYSKEKSSAIHLKKPLKVQKVKVALNFSELFGDFFETQDSSTPRNKDDFFGSRDKVEDRLLFEAGYTKLFKPFSTNTYKPNQNQAFELPTFYSRHVSNFSSKFNDPYFSKLYKLPDHSKLSSKVFGIIREYNNGTKDDENSSCYYYNYTLRANLVNDIVKFLSDNTDAFNSIFPGFNSEIAVEYDMDEQDAQFLKIINQERFFSGMLFC